MYEKSPLNFGVQGAFRQDVHLSRTMGGIHFATSLSCEKEDNVKGEDCRPLP